MPNAALASDRLRVRDLRKYFFSRESWLLPARRAARVVDGLSFDLGAGETLGLVGESGCGKTTAGRCIARLIRPTSGDVRLDGSPNLADLPSRRLLPWRREMQMIFQDPYSSLNPRMTVGAAIAEALAIHRLAPRRERWDHVRRLLDDVGLDSGCARRFPHEFSGGQRQRIGIARALAVRPRVVIADEPVSALDVSIQAQIINLLRRIQEQTGISLIFIAHDLAVVGHISHRVAVMYLGRIVEIGPKLAVFENPAHPYTQALLAAVPKAEPRGKGARRLLLEGDPPSPAAPPGGCAFHPRCPSALARCRQESPPVFDLGGGHESACWLAESSGTPK